jgi:hypothetical protein
VKKVLIISIMPSEPAWSKSYFSSSTVCTWFYALAILNAIIAVAGVIGAVILSTRGKGGAATLIPLLVSGGLGFINAWFLFLMCNRGINKDSFRNF